jgi:hypothetical protein
MPLLTREIRPSEGHCLYFPKRPKGRRCVVGEATRIWRFFSREEWKHVPLGQFKAEFPPKGKPSLVLTSEGLRCKVEAVFTVVSGGYLEGREERIELSTDTWAASRQAPTPVGFERLERWAENICANAITDIVEKSSFLQLVEPNGRADAREAIKAKLSGDLGRVGLVFVSGVIGIEVADPEMAGVPPEIAEKWLELTQRRNAERLAADKEQKTFLEQQAVAETKHQITMAEETRQRSRLIKEVQEAGAVDVAKVQADRDVKLKEQEGAKEMLLADLQKGIDDLHSKAQQSLVQRQADAGKNQAVANHATELEKRRLAAQLEDEEHQRELKRRKRREEFALTEHQETVEGEKRAAEVAQEQHAKNIASKRQEAELEQEASKLLRMKDEVSELQVRLAAAQTKLAEADLEVQRKRWEIANEGAKGQSLAVAAATLQMNAAVLQALPEIFRNASNGSGKVGEVRILAMPGKDGGSVGPLNLNDLIAGTSVIPMLKEVFQFVSGFAKVESEAPTDAAAVPKESGFPNSPAMPMNRAG